MGSTVINAKDLLTTVIGSSTTSIGNALSNIYLSPQTLSNTRLQMYSAMYERYRFKRFTVHFTPSVSTSTPGQLMIAYDRDISDDTPPNNLDGLRQYSSWPGTFSSPIWSPFRTSFSLQSPQDGLFCSPNGVDMRFEYQGQLYVVDVNGNLSNTSSYGLMFIEYEIEFFEPQLEPLVLLYSRKKAVDLLNPPLDSLGTGCGWNGLTSGTLATGSSRAVQLQPTADGLMTRLRIPPGTWEMLETVGKIVGGDVLNGMRLPTILEYGRSTGAKINYNLASNTLVDGASQFIKSFVFNPGPDPIDLIGNLQNENAVRFDEHVLSIKRLSEDFEQLVAAG